MMLKCCVVSWVIVVFASNVSAQEDFDQPAARGLLKKVVDFHRTQVGYRGAYLWRYSADLTRQEGEGVATKTSGWTQPPGTPAVGEAFLTAYLISGEEVCLHAAKEAAEALVEAQLKSGGWSSHFDLQPPGRNRYAYRVDGEKAGQNNYTTFDDDKTQSALRFLVRVDEVLKFEDEPIHEAVQYAIENILSAQYSNGGWPQQYREPSQSTQPASLRASYPKSWPREHPQVSYRHLYTLNDHNMSKLIDTFIEAHRIYERQDCYDAVVKTGEFYLLAQMPDPQPGWAQQYDMDMHPAWARKFEPPSITGGESQSVMRDLIKLYRFTGQSRFIEPVPRALEYFKQSQLESGKLARFYELQTNRPLYFDREYQLTYDSDDVPTHYSFVVSSKLGSIEKEYERAKERGKDAWSDYRPPTPVQLTKGLKQSAEKVANALDERGAWLERKQMRGSDSEEDVIDMRTFANNLVTLARYVGATP